MERSLRIWRILRRCFSNGLIRPEGKTRDCDRRQQGIGLALARFLAQAGAQVVVFYHHTKFEAEDRIQGVSCDLLDRQDMQRAFCEAVSLLGGVDILVNAAGLHKKEDAEHFPLEEWENIQKVNVFAAFRMCQLAGNEMIRQGGGKIVNICSVRSVLAGERSSAYSTSKAALLQMTKRWQRNGENTVLM